MNKKAQKLLIMTTLMFLTLTIESSNTNTFAENNAANFYPSPYEDSEMGRNTNVYMPLIEGPSAAEQQLFIEEIARHATTAQETSGIPAAAIIGMAALESGYGTTRIAYYANNLFGIKVWGGDSSNAWQLTGQPDEDFEQAIPVMADYGEDRKVYDETERRDNWYRKFLSYGESVEYLAGTLLVNERYAPARDAYLKHLQDGWSEKDATLQYLYDIAEVGYNHLGGNYYRESVGRLIEQWSLLEYQSGYSEVELDAVVIVLNDGSRTPFSELDLEKLHERTRDVKVLQEAIEVVEDSGNLSENRLLRWLQDLIAWKGRLF